MSLLHEALKKASHPQASGLRDGPFIDREDPPGGTPTRVFVLLAIAVACLLFFAYVRFFRKSGSAPVATAGFKTPLEMTGGQTTPELAERGGELFQSRKYEEARAIFERVVILEPGSAEAYNNLGLASRKLGRNEEAFDQYRRALFLDPQCVECMNNLGVLYLANRDFTEAEAQFQKALELRPNYSDPYFHLGLLLEARGDLSGAKKNLVKFVELAKGVEASFLLQVQERIASLETP